MQQAAAITITAYQAFQQAYDFFNRELFAGSLPQVLVTLQRHAKTYGYFSPQRFSGRIDKSAVHELALNPDGFHGRTDALILSTLVHEMCHVWQETHGTPPRRGYHDRGIHLSRDSWVSVRYPEGLNSAKSSDTPQRTDRHHGIVGQKRSPLQCIRTHGQQSVRCLAERTGLSKSSVHRHLQAINRRDCYPESSLWETEAGRNWLIRLVVATLFVLAFSVKTRNFGR
jgi:hypothetical protein